MVERVESLAEKYGHVSLIVCGNFGTTSYAAIDNIPAINQALTELQNKYKSTTNGQKSLQFTIHIDGALYMPTLPVLNQWGPNITDQMNYFEKLNVNTIAFCFHKFFGASVPAGMCLTSKNFIYKAFSN